MKKILFLFLLFISSSLYAKTIRIVIPDSDIKIVDHYVISSEAWIQEAWAMKVAACKERLVKEEIDRSLRERVAIPAGGDEILKQAISSRDFKSRLEMEKAK